LRAFLKADVMLETGGFERTLTGTPQRGSISPWLTNVALTALDRRYATDWADMSRYTGRREYLRHIGRPPYWLVRFADVFVESRMRGNAHVRFGGRWRGDRQPQGCTTPRRRPYTSRSITRRRRCSSPSSDPDKSVAR